ncbi:protein FAM161B [Megalops cyprinoides]|uniref:protein FAM161B n=1 Tax=Megalops cyprinoides TaxID=118141 RepID=UPI0018642C46|nr:protein FAM161B [Megalops cyprinoides]
MGDMLAFLQQDGGSPAETEQLLQQRLQALKKAHRQQLQKTCQVHQQGLEKRLLHNSLLSAGNERKAGATGHLEDFFSLSDNQNINMRPGSEAPSSVKSVGSNASPKLRITQRPATTAEARASCTTVPKPFNITLREGQRKSQLLQNKVPLDTERLLGGKMEAEEAECQKQFRAAPVPGHVFLPLYHDITEVREQVRKAGIEQRQEFLLSIQKPFSFVEREEKKKTEMKQQLCSPALLPQTTKSIEVRIPIPKAVLDPGVSEHLKEKELHRKIRIQIRAQDMLRSSMAPIKTQVSRGDEEKRSSHRTRKEVLGFLDEKPSFQPRTNPQVPEFDKLHKALQKEALKRTEQKDVTRCQPFQLRTSALPPRRRQKTPEPSQDSGGKTDLKRSHSFSGITSLSTDTLPTYITDAARKRGSAIRRSMEEKMRKESENAHWMEQHKVRSQAMKSMVTSRARAVDPHKSLKEVYHEKLKQHRETDQKRMREYKRELHEMKTRVKVRPYLFEQVTQKNAKSGAERRYRDTLEQAGLNEHFVRQKGESAGVTPPFTSDDEDATENDTHHMRGTEEATPNTGEENIM